VNLSLKISSKTSSLKEMMTEFTVCVTIPLKLILNQSLIPALLEKELLIQPNLNSSYASAS